MKTNAAKRSSQILPRIEGERAPLLRSVSDELPPLIPENLGPSAEASTAFLDEWHSKTLKNVAKSAAIPYVETSIESNPWISDITDY